MTEISESRQNDLRKAYEDNVAAGKPPYFQAPIYSRDELDWIIRERQWLTNREDLYKAEAESASAAHLHRRADLRGIIMYGIDLSGVYLDFVDLSGAYFPKSNLRGAHLYSARLWGADCARSDFSDADLRYLWLSDDTNLNSITFDRNTLCHGIRWRNAQLSLINWRQVTRLGDEKLARRTKNRRERVEAYRKAALAYRGLSLTLQEQGFRGPASRFRSREQQLERHASIMEGKVGAWFFSFLLDAISGYGEKPGRILITYLLVVLGFASLYLGIAHNWDPSYAIDAVVFSLTSFHGRGFFPGTVATPHDVMVVLAAVEAVTGLFIELILIATFSRRILNQ
jgi:hypothetical protein